MNTIMVVDDHPAICLALRSYIGQSGQLRVVSEASNGNEAMGKIRQERPDLVIVDLMLANSDGLELIRQIRQFDPLIRILVLSAREERVYIARAQEQGANGYVFKSRPLEDVLHAVQVVLTGYHCFPVDPGLIDDGCPETDSLSRRELAVLNHIARGCRNKDIAALLFISPKTVSTYKMRLLDKLKLRTTLDLAEYARSNGLG